MNKFLKRKMSRRDASRLIGGGALVAAMSGQIIQAQPGSASAQFVKQDSVIVLIEATVRDGEIDRLIQFLKENLPNTRSFRGALKIVVFYDEYTGSLAIYEEWLARQHHKNYVKFITDKGVMKQLVGFLKAPPTMKYYDRLEI